MCICEVNYAMLYNMKLLVLCFCVQGEAGVNGGVILY